MDQVSDVDVLVSAIPGERPTGESLLYDPIYDEIREARREDDPTLPQGVWQHDLKKANWSRVARLCSESLITRSKDLMLAVWLVEAWTHASHLRGTRDGVRLIRRLCEDFWDDLYPAIEDGDLGGRLAPIELLNQRAAQLVKRTKITATGTADAHDFTWMDWEADHVRAEEEEREDVSRAAILAAASLTPLEVYTALHEEAKRAREEITALSELLQDKCGAMSPSLANLIEAVEGVGAFAKRIRRERQPMEDLADSETDSPTDPTEESERAGQAARQSSASMSTGQINSRAEAYYLLTLAADYLQSTEPHSPAPYLVRRAIGWGGMSLADLLRELLANNADLETVYSLLGIDSDHP